MLLNSNRGRLLQWKARDLKLHRSKRLQENNKGKLLPNKNKELKMKRKRKKRFQYRLQVERHLEVRQLQEKLRLQANLNRKKLKTRPKNDENKISKIIILKIYFL